MTELELIIALLAQPAGYEISVEGQLMIGRMRDGRYAVTAYGYVAGAFVGPGEAAELFLAKRQEQWLGWDLDPPT